MEGIILLWIEHFEQGRGGVAVVGHLGDLVDFIEDEHGIARASLLDRLDDASGHGTDIGTTVSADLGFIMQAT